MSATLWTTDQLMAILAALKGARVDNPCTNPNHDYYNQGYLDALADTAIAIGAVKPVQRPSPPTHRRKHLTTYAKYTDAELRGFRMP